MRQESPIVALVAGSSQRPRSVDVESGCQAVCRPALARRRTYDHRPDRRRSPDIRNGNDPAVHTISVYGVADSRCRFPIVQRQRRTAWITMHAGAVKFTVEKRVQACRFSAAGNTNHACICPSVFKGQADWTEMMLLCYE